MSRAFEEQAPVHVVFGAGSVARVASLLADHAAQRVLLISLPHHREVADRIAAGLGERCLGVFDRVRQHVPEALVDEAVQAADGADWVMACGGGTCIGFAKAVALRRDVQVGAVVTTYSGSERTPIWGLTGPDGKRTGRDPRVRPSLVVYDPELTVGLDPTQSLQGLFNGLAHATGVLWGSDTPGHIDEAVAAIEALVAALPKLHRDPRGAEARADALHAAYLAAGCIERAPLALQHALAHTLGGTFDVVHSAAHTASLPYSVGYNLAARPEVMDRLTSALGEDPPARLYDLAREHGLPHSYKDLGLTLDDLPRLVERVLARDYPNPRAVTEASLTELVFNAYHARRPSRFSRRRSLVARGPHGSTPATERGAPLEEARAVLIAVHGRGAAADRITRDLEAFLPQAEGLTVLAPQALDNAWYPKGFTAPIEQNQPALDSALSVLDACWQHAVEAVGPDRVVLAGFSQGACLLLGWAATRHQRPRALLAFSGAELLLCGDYANLGASQVALSKSEGDPYIPADRFERTARRLGEAVSNLEVRIEPGHEHRITESDGDALARAIEAALAP